MKKSILNLGKALNKAEQKLINGGGRVFICFSDADCATQIYKCCSPNTNECYDCETPVG